MRSVLERLLCGESLGEQEAGSLLTFVTDPDTPPAVAGALLAAMRTKGESPAEVRGLAGAMLASAIRIPPDGGRRHRGNRWRRIGQSEPVDRLGPSRGGERHARLQTRQPVRFQPLRKRRCAGSARVPIADGSRNRH